MPKARFIGDKVWRELHDPAFTVDSWGVDHARWKWSGAFDLRQAFIDGLRRWQTLPGYSFMRLASWSEEEHRSFPSVELHYTGLKTGSPPEARAEDSTTTQSAQVSGTLSGAQVSGVFTYRASRTTWRWCEVQSPAKTSRYTDVRRAEDNPLKMIETFSATETATGKKKTVSFQQFIVLLNQLKLEKSVSSYRVEDEIPGLLWTCTADVDYKFAN